MAMLSLPVGLIGCPIRHHPGGDEVTSDPAIDPLPMYDCWKPRKLTWKWNTPPFLRLLMAEILHQFIIGSLSHYLQGYSTIPGGG